MAEEESHDRNMKCDWEFVQGSQVEENLIVDKDKKETWYDVSGKQDYSWNQSECKRRSKARKL